MVNEENVKLVQKFLIDKERKILEFDEGDKTMIIVKIPYAEGYEKLCSDYCYGRSRRTDNEGKYDLHNSIDYQGILDMETGEVFECGWNIREYVNYKPHDLTHYDLVSSVAQKFQELYYIGVLKDMLKGEVTDNDKENIERWARDNANNLYVANVKVEDYGIPVYDANNYYTLVDILNSRDPEKKKQIVGRIVMSRIDDKNFDMKRYVLYERVREILTELWDNGDSYLDVLKALKKGITEGMNTVKLKIKTNENDSITVGLDTKGIKCLSPNYRDSKIYTYYVSSLKERNLVEQHMKDIDINDILTISYRGKKLYEKEVV